MLLSEFYLEGRRETAEEGESWGGGMKVKKPTRAELFAALVESENALLDYVERLEKQGGRMNYGRSIIRLIQELRLREAMK